MRTRRMYLGWFGSSLSARRMVSCHYRQSNVRSTSTPDLFRGQNDGEADATCRPALVVSRCVSNTYCSMRFYASRRAFGICSNPVLRSSESSVRTYVPAPENVGPAGLVSERPPGEVETRGESKEGIWFTRAEGTTRKNN